MRFNSIRFKTSILYTLILGIILSIYSGVIFHGVRVILYRNLDESLKVKAKEVSDILRAYHQVERVDNQHLGLIADIFRDDFSVFNKMVVDELWHSAVKTLNLKSDYIHILTPKGRLILFSDNVQEEIAKTFHADLPAVPQIMFKDIHPSGLHLRAINFSIDLNGRPWLIIQIATPMTAINYTLDKLGIFILAAVCFILILTSFLGGVLARSVLKPVENITTTVDQISHRDLHVRLEERQPDEEIKRLVNSFNLMLGRLEESFNHINEFSSNVAHELKTPLAIIRGEIELALSGTHSVDDYKRVLENSMEEINRLIRIIKDLLLLANLDYRSDIFKFENFDFSGFIREIGENGKVLAAEKGILMTSHIPEVNVYVLGDKVHLRRLFFNLISNAVKFTSSGGQIQFSLKVKDKKACVSIVDNGIGISKDNIDRIFKKFFRVNKEESPELSSGLGLNIAQAIAKAHQGEISVESEINKGSTFTVTIPLS